MDRVDVSSLEACERDFRKAAKMLAAMLEPPSGKVKFRVFGYVRFGFIMHKDDSSGFSVTGDGILGWTSIIKEKDNLELTFIDLKNEDMVPSFSAEINDESTLEIVSPLEAVFHFKRTSVYVSLGIEVEMDQIVKIVFKHNKRCFSRSARFCRTPSPRLVSRPLFIRSIPHSEDTDGGFVKGNRPSTPVIPRSWRPKVNLNRASSRSFEHLGIPSNLTTF